MQAQWRKIGLSHTNRHYRVCEACVPDTKQKTGFNIKATWTAVSETAPGFGLAQPYQLLSNGQTARYVTDTYFTLLRAFSKHMHTNNNNIQINKKKFCFQPFKWSKLLFHYSTKRSCIVIHLHAVNLMSFSFLSKENESVLPLEEWHIGKENHRQFKDKMQKHSQ